MKHFAMPAPLRPFEIGGHFFRLLRTRKSPKNCKCPPALRRYATCMSAEQIVGLVLALLLMCVGVAGSILPGLPSTPVVLLSAIAHKLYFGATGAAWWVIAVLAALTVLSLIVDYLASVYGAKRLGATWRGAIGAIVGGLVGLAFSFPGILLGPFLGAFVFELVGRRAVREASLAGVGATLGLLAGVLGKLACCIAMMTVFAVNVIYRSVA